MATPPVLHREPVFQQAHIARFTQIAGCKLVLLQSKRLCIGIVPAGYLA